MLNLNSLMLGSGDADALCGFYTRILGEPAWEDSGRRGWQIGNAGLIIGPHSEVKGRNDTPGRMLINFETPDVHGEFERIKALGATVKQAPYKPGGEGDAMWIATFEDLDGNYFQLVSPMTEGA